MSKQVSVYDNTVSARTYISYIAEQAGGFACIGRDGKLYIKKIGQNIVSLPLRYFEKYSWGEKIKIRRIKYEDGIQLFEKGNTTGNTIYINQENMYIVSQEQIDNIYNLYKDLEIYSFEGDSIIDPAVDVGDLLLIDNKCVIYQGSKQYCGKWKANISSKIQCKAREETMSKTPTQKNINRRVQSRIDQAEGIIEQTVTEVGEQNQKISKVVQTVDELRSTISDVADLTISAEGNGKVVLAGINESEPIRIVVRPVGTDIKYLYPSDKLYPSNNLYLPNRKIRFATDTYYKDWEIPEDLLYYDAEHYDELILDYDSQTCIVNKRVGFDANRNKIILTKPKTNSYTYPKIPLESGDYTVTVLGYPNAYIFARLMSKNIYTTQFATKAEVGSSISQTVNEIDLSVRQKLTNYSTTTEMNSAINLKADSITSTVEGKYATKDALNSAKSQIQQTEDRITSTVEQKYATKDQLSSVNSKIEQTADSITSTVRKVNNIQIGGVNLIPNSGPFNAENDEIKSYVITNNEEIELTLQDEENAPYKKCLRVRTLKQLSSSHGIYVIPTTKILEEGKEYCYSIYLKATANTNVLVGYPKGGENTFNVTTNWQKFTHTFTATKATGNSHGFKVYLPSGTTAGRQVFIHSIKLEEGNKSTTWSAALEEVPTKTEMYSVIKQTTDSIMSTVNKKVGDEEFGTKIEQDFESVKIAWNKNSKNVQFENGEIALYDGEISLQNKRAVFNYNGNHFYLGGNYIGKIGTNSMVDNNSQKGLTFDIENNTAYMSWAWKEKTDDNFYLMKWTFTSEKINSYESNTLNAGCDINMNGYTLKNVCFEGGGITGKLKFIQPLKFNSDGTLQTWSTAVLEFKNGILVEGSWSNTEEIGD